MGAHRHWGTSAPGFPHFFAAVHVCNGFTCCVFTSASPQITAHLSWCNQPFRSSQWAAKAVGKQRSLPSRIWPHPQSSAQCTAGRRHWGDKAFGSKNSDSAGINRTHLGIYFPTQCSFFTLHDPVLFLISCFLAYFVFSCLSSPAWTSVSMPLPSLRVCHSAPDLTTHAGTEVASGQVILPAPWELTSSETGGGISKFNDTHLLPQNLFFLPGDGQKS